MTGSPTRTDLPKFAPNPAPQPQPYFLTSELSPYPNFPIPLSLPLPRFFPSDFSHPDHDMSAFPRPPSPVPGLRTQRLLHWVCLTSPPLSAGARGRKNQLHEASMENGERKKLSSAPSDGDHKEENSLYLCVPRLRQPYSKCGRGAWG